MWTARVKVPSTSSLSVYTEVLGHNLNDIRNWASLIGLLFRICWCLLSIFLIYCSDEWKKLVNLIYCFQVLFRMNFKIMYFLMKILGTTLFARSFRRRVFAYSYTVNHPHTNIILSWFSIPLVLKCAAKILKIGLQIKILRPKIFWIGILNRQGR